MKLCTIASLVAATTVGLVTGPMLAEEIETPDGPLSATVAIGVAGYSNHHEALDKTESWSRAYGELGLSYQSQRPLDTLTINGGFEVGIPDEHAIHTPYLNANYARNGANAALTFGASLADVDLSDASAAGAGFSSGFRTDFGANGRFRYNTSGKYVPYVAVNYASKDYRDAGENGIDYTQSSLAFGSEFILDPITSFDISFASNNFENELDVTATSTTLTFSARHDRPMGPLRATGSLTQSDAGDRFSITAGRIYQFAGGSFDANAGLTKTISGEVIPVGDFSFAKDISTGTFIADLSRTVREDGNNIENTSTLLDLSFHAQLTELSAIDLGLERAVNDVTATDESTDSLTVSAAYMKNLNQQTLIGLSVQHRIEGDETGRLSDNSAVYLKLTRSF